MRNTFFYLLVLLATVACGKNGVEITGSVLTDNINNGDSVYLMTVSADGGVSIVERCAVRDKKFSLSCDIDAPAIFNLVVYVPQVGVKRSIDFIAENGVVAVEIGDKNNRVSGTSLNNELQNYADSIAVVTKLYTRYYDKKARTPELSDKAVEEADKVMKVTAVYHREIVYRTIERNIGNILGVYLIKKNIDILEPLKGVEFIEKLPADRQSEYQIAYMYKLYKALDRYAVGKPYADVVQKNADGDDVCISSFVGRGKPVVISFWSLGNDRSINEQKKIFALHKEHGDATHFVGISLDTDYEKWLSAIKKHGLSGIQLTDLRGWNNAALTVYGVDKCPYNILIDKMGNIAYRGTSSVELADKLKSMVAE